MDLKTISDIYKSEISYLDYILTDNNEYIFNKYSENLVEINENKEDKKIKEKKEEIWKINDIKEKKKCNIFFIKKNRNIFKVINPNKFYIFNSGFKDKFTRKFIDDTLKKKKFIILENMEKPIKIIIKQNRKYDFDNIRKKIKQDF